MMAMRMTGRKLRVWVGSTPIRLAPQPHWKIAIWAPRAAPADSRKPMIEVIGTMMVRNAKVSSRNARMMMVIRKIGSASSSFADTSMLVATRPPTSSFAPVFGFERGAVVADPVDQVGGGLIVGPGGRDHAEQGDAVGRDRNR